MWQNIYRIMAVSSENDSIVANNCSLLMATKERGFGKAEECLTLERKYHTPSSQYLKGWRLYWTITG